MLQIALRFMLLVVLASGAVRLPEADTALPEWVLKDIPEQDFIAFSQVSVTMPADVRLALDLYRHENFRKTIEILEKLRLLKLPDDRFDFIVFVLGESYRKLGCIGLAQDDYRYVIGNFPGSDKTPASVYRLLEFAVTNEEPAIADSLYAAFCAKYPDHPLINSVHYLGALINYQHAEYDMAVEKLKSIDPASSIYLRTLFLSALCSIQRKEYPEALATLKAVRGKSSRGEIGNETVILTGDICYLQNAPESALKNYRKVPKKAKRYQYALVKIAQCWLDIGNYKKSAKIAGRFLQENETSAYYFEMASVLEEAYTRLGDRTAAGLVGNLIRRQIVNARLAFEIFDEIDRIADMLSSWQGIEHVAIREGKKDLKDAVTTNTKELQDLEQRYYALLKVVAPGGLAGRQAVPFQAERRYLGMLKTRMELYDDTLNDLHKQTEASRLRPAYDTGKSSADSLRPLIDFLKSKREQCDHEYSCVIKQCIGKEYKNREGDEEFQAKIVDWVFAKYQEAKERLKQVSVQLAEQQRKKNAAKNVTVAAAPVAEAKKNAAAPPIEQKTYTEADRDRLTGMIADDREGIISHLRTILDVYPQSKFNPQILFRLAELYYDAAGDEFQDALKAYEKKMALGKDTAGIEFPEYHLEKVIATYETIIAKYPHDETVESAVFYRALALQKLGREEDAAAALTDLIDKYPQSGFFVEANMMIGKYFFDHPKALKGQGYKLAEEAYRRVLFFRDHPQFISALYHLGWCYYMQDKYEDAMAVFKYLIQGSHLDFDLSKKDENQVANPLLRDEAVDYIAVSFDVLNKIDEASEFLKSTGSADYSAMVMKRIGELREEDLDYTKAIRVYRQLLANYPDSREAPNTYVALIKLYDAHGHPDSAMALREEFSARYHRGSDWQKDLDGDTAARKSIDSMAVANGLFVADATYRLADSTKDREVYSRAARDYERLVESYPDELYASEALWNLAVILDTKLQDKEQAFTRYTAFSKLTGMDSTRREQAALNAVAIAQGLLPPDSLAKKREMDSAAVRVVNAIKNYCAFFPHGASWSKVMLSLGAVYFNRRLFADAEATYGAIISHGHTGADYFEALLFLGKCRYAEENWQAAIDAFSTIWKSAQDETQRAAAKKLLVQCEFLNAKKTIDAGNFGQAADLYRAIDEKYPGSEYGDVVLFSAAEALEKISKWQDACSRYLDLAKRYPQSKLAAGALFNAAGDFEKINRFDGAADCYTRIVSDYPASDKAKDALFNVGFCYEKLGKPDKMAEVNQEYAERYPGEKDDETMLLRSGAYYAKAGILSKAVEVYHTFINHYPKSTRSIEAYFMIAKCYYDQGYKDNAMIAFAQTEQQNDEFGKANITTDNFHAAEAAYYTALIKREKFLDLKFVGSGESFKETMREKSELLAEAEIAFRRVMEYRSVRIFEAACRIGQLYEELADAWKNQERPVIDPIKAAVRERDILTQTSELLRNSFIPFKKALQLAKEFDSLSAEQKGWVGKSESRLKRDLFDAGDLLWTAKNSMRDAPIPGKIRQKPVHYYQYRKKLLEALLPLKEQTRDYYASALVLADSMLLKGREIDSCVDRLAYVNYSIGSEYDSLTAEITRVAREARSDLSKEEKEDIAFQLQDIAYELQDKAILAYEEGLAFSKSHNLQAISWSGRIIESLARLNPAKYGASLYRKVIVASDSSWAVREDTLADWNKLQPPREGWGMAVVLQSCDQATFKVGNARYMWGNVGSKRGYFWKNVFLAGAPRSADLRIIAPGKYRLFINNILILSDTLGKAPAGALGAADSAIGIASVLKGGDNCIAAEVIAPDSGQPRVAIVFSVMIDTSEHFTSSVQVPTVFSVKQAAPAPATLVQQTAPAVPQQAATRHDTAAALTSATTAVSPAPHPAIPENLKTRAEVREAMENLHRQEITAADEMEKETAEIQRLQAESDSVDVLLKQVKAQINAKKLRGEEK